MSVSEPGKIITPWAESGLKNPIPPAANPATGRAGFDQGFSAINMTAKEAGGIPPFGQDFNGIFYEVTNILRYMQAGGQPTFDSALATAIGGYPKGAMVLGSDGVTLWQSKVDSNSTNPNTDPSDWGTFDIGLKADLAAPGGSGIVGFQQNGAGSVPRTSQDKMRERITPPDYGAIGDGVTNDSAAFVELETNHVGKDVDMLGRSYFVDEAFRANRYYNGVWILQSGTSRPRWQGTQLTGAGRIVFGENALALIPDTYGMGTDGTVIALGYQAMSKMTEVKKAIAIGTGSQSEGTISRDNISIGEDTLKFVQARTPNYDQSRRQGTRNLAIGGNAGRFIFEGYNNNVIGRNAGSCIVNNTECTVYGSNAANGYAPIGLSGVIENWAPNNGPDGFTAVGSDALSRTITGFNVAFGNDAAKNLVAGRGNTVVGHQAFAAAESGSGFNGKVKTDLNIDCIYSHAGNVLTITTPAPHGFATDWTVGIRLLDGGSQTFQGDVAPVIITSIVDANTFTVAHPTARTASGNAHLYWSLNLTNAPVSDFNVITGALAGYQAANLSSCTLTGYRSGQLLTGGNNSVAYGANTLYNATQTLGCTAIGFNSLRNNSDGSLATGTLANRTALGNDARTSGDNQVQLGNASTTTYVYGTVQNRSDARDKTDVVNTALGIEFILGLRPVDGRWDMRDDYWEEYDEQVGVDAEGLPVFETKRRQIPKDGSRARQRKHHWFIAQEVKELCDSLGVEFGGYQDHSVNGGCDVLTLGYDEFIPPTVKAVQQCWARLDELEKRIAALE